MVIEMKKVVPLNLTFVFRKKSITEKTVSISANLHFMSSLYIYI